MQIPSDLPSPFADATPEDRDQFIDRLRRQAMTEEQRIFLEGYKSGSTFAWKANYIQIEGFKNLASSAGDDSIQLPHGDKNPGNLLFSLLFPGESTALAEPFWQKFRVAGAGDSPEFIAGFGWGVLSVWDDVKDEVLVNDR